MSAQQSEALDTGPDVPDQSLTSSRAHLGDGIFKGVSIGSGVLILAILAAVAAFLIIQAVPAFIGDPEEMQFGSTWSYVAPYLFGTIWSSFLALLFAVPVAVGIALYISHYAPRRLATPVAFVIDLLAAVPSVVFGLWGINVMAPAMVPLYQWLNTYLGFIPLFGGDVSGTGRTMLTAALVLAIMILPIITALSREVFLRTPGLQEEASMALGATKWEMIRQVVIPFGRSGIVSAAMLGLGRALGETMAVAMVLSGGRTITFQLLSSQNPNTIASNIALAFPEADRHAVPQLIATGLVLFVITFLVNMAGRAITGGKFRPVFNAARAGKEDSE
ncbi:MAG: phosphate ABC transporter permease subunit PstC [Brooklawnia sp.]|uniref:phosphate ABC transporter permease subunit PstC n=1 Tax=Brooklawnia sp. TaxID=2699740 RepID=UPI003C74E90D